MTFFAPERTSLREKSSQYSYDYNKRYDDMLNGLNGNFSFGRNSGFTESPYENFRQNVATYCERFMFSSFDQGEFMTSEEKSLSVLRGAGWNARLAEGDAWRCDHAEQLRSDVDFQEHNGDELESLAEQEYRKHCYCSSDVICEHCRVRPSKSDTNVFSVMSVSLEPLQPPKPKKPSLLKKITHLMNSDYKAHKEKVTISPTASLKQRGESSKWNTCACHIHYTEHRNCCQCQEPYHRMNCECVQHNGSHSYCCRCDPHLLQEYDQHVKKKRYLRLLSDDELSPCNSADHQGGGTSGFPRVSFRTDATNSAGSGRKLFKKNYKMQSQLSRPETGDRPSIEAEDDAGESDGNHHPCESCCQKLDTIYGTALREVHSMLMDVSRTLLPPAHCCSLDTRIQNVSRLRPSPCQIGSLNLETVESNEAEREREDMSGTNEVGVQVTPKDISGNRPRKKATKMGKLMKNKCAVS